MASAGTRPPAPDVGADDWTTRMEAVRRAMVAVRESSARLRVEMDDVRDSTRRSRDAAWRARERSDALANTVEAALRPAEPAAAEAMRERIAHLEHELEGLQRAMQTRGVIEQAKGMIMLRDHCDADTAFQTLVRVSQLSHRKLFEVAGLVVEWACTESAAPTVRR